MRSLLFPVYCAVLLTSCGSDEPPASFGRRVVLPDATVVRAETMMQDLDMAKGMMFRNSLEEGKGMLFVHQQPGKHGYWMYQVNIPLDLIWMDMNGRVVEIVENAPPCKTPASQCPNYGGNQTSQVVLELPGGTARKHGVVVGSTIDF